MKRILCNVVVLEALVLLCAACATHSPPHSGTTVTIEVTTLMDGISSEDTETAITTPLENFLVTMPSLRGMHSISGHGRSRIWLQLKGITAPDALKLVRQQVAEAAGRLPAGATRPVVTESRYPE